MVSTSNLRNKIRNPKHEIRNKTAAKQIKTRKIPNLEFDGARFEFIAFGSFEFVSVFGFRASFSWRLCAFAGGSILIS